jgi:hypothetical protein
VRLLFFLQLKQEYDVVKHMCNQSGWGWDYEKNAPEVSDKVWDAYIKVRLLYTMRLYLSLCSLQKVSNQTMAKPLRKKGFPLFDDIAELVGATRATGQNAFRAGQPTPAPSTQNTAASASTSYEPVIDPVLLEGGMVTDEEMDHAIPLVIYIHQYIYVPLTTIQDNNNMNTAVNTPRRSFVMRGLHVSA